MQAYVRSEVPAPPVMALLGVQLGSVEPGKVSMRLPPAEHLYNVLGSVHGGVIATLLDSAMGCAVHTSLPAGRGYTTLEFKVNFVRKVTVESGTMTAEGRLLHSGRHTALAEASLIGPDGKLYAIATTTCLVFDLPSG